MMPLFRSTAVALLILTTPAYSQEPNYVELGWSLFSTHCVKYLEAEAVGDIATAFAPHQIELNTTTDGAVQSGQVSLENPRMFGEGFASFYISTARIDGGVLRNCTLHLTSGPGDFDNLAPFVQRHVGDILGEKYNVKGGYTIKDKELSGAALQISTPEFPPEKTISLLQTTFFQTLAIHTMIAE